MSAPAERDVTQGFKLEPVADCTFGAVVTDVTITALDEISFARLYRLWLEYALLIFPGQDLSVQRQIAFARRFGPLEFEHGALTNLRADGEVETDEHSGHIKILRGNMEWHFDSTYLPVQAKGAVLSAEVVPVIGGETSWADMRAAFDALTPDQQADLRGRSARHSRRYSHAKIGHTPRDPGFEQVYGMDVGRPPLRPLVKVHPETRRSALIIGRHAHAVTGLDQAGSDALLSTLQHAACQAPRVYTHRWSAGDVVVWDNRCLMHRGHDWNLREPRTMHHSRLAGDPASEFAAGDVDADIAIRENEQEQAYVV